MSDKGKYYRHRMACRIVGFFFFVDAFHPFVSGIVYLCHPSWTIRFNGQDRPDAVFKILLAGMGLLFLGLGALLAFSPRRWLDQAWEYFDTRAREYRSSRVLRQ
jgi:hypothetical protein